MTAHARMGMRIGLVAGLLICAVISAVRLLEGAAPFERMGVTYLGLMAIYLLMATLTGSIIGGLWKFASSRTGAYAIGMIAALPVVVGVLLQNSGHPSHWDSEWRLGPVLWFVAALVIGSEIQRRTTTRA